MRRAVRATLVAVLAVTAALTVAAPPLVPLCDMAGEARYKGESGGLYGDGRNEPPAEHLAAALERARATRPTRDGERVVLLAIGMSNTTQEFQAFLRLAGADRDKAPWLVPVDGAQGARDAAAWARDGSCWEVAEQRLAAAGCRPEQVRVVWIKQALAGPARLGAYPAHADRLREALAAIVRTAHDRYANLEVAYLSSRIYAGYASTQLNPEPYAYESAFAVRRLILDQIAGRPELNFDPARGDVRAPLLLWGPYLWADGATPRGDGLTWQREDLRADDGTHPSDAGRRKVARLLLEFCHADPTARIWYTGRE